ncbi:right-handed parallel beta-helix repeat-containing protein [Streptomyces sp. NBC_00572]|uniref:right-handed parallel beta-helix repeat-containing protein n=1 Tax=Streptomyces sp. NBC_00572 TaxID=2903664 RepID=UPI00225A9188|nr:right-handed parallel beta-helix repeat-containing protein [Streptomyces sp. NBC_00572]MCX4980764.1 right-handed parallel beta-helix repeat-containing protein [Streptomyces sp. NBC_00572]
MVARYVVSPRGGRRAHPDITSALRAAAARGRAALIEIAPGRYEETLVVRGDVQLVAVEGPGSVMVGRPRGTVLDASGSVRVHGLTLVGREADVVACHTGTLTLEHTEIRAHSGVAVHARPHTTVNLRDSVVTHGRALFTGGAALVERCRFTDAADNAIAVLEGARVSVRGSRIEGSRIHGLRVSDAHAEVVGCELTGTGQAALTADARARLVVADCVISAVHGEGIMFTEQSRGSVDNTRVTGARHGIGAASGADPVVRGCVLTDCRDTGINVQTEARGRFEDCQVLNSGNIAVFSTRGGAPEVHGGRIAGGNVGIAVSEGGSGRFGHLRVEDLTSVALRVWSGSAAAFDHVRVERCPSGLETQGDSGTTADLTDTLFRDFTLPAVTAAGQSRATLRRVTAERGTVGFGVTEDAQLFLHDCEVSTVSSGGAIGMGNGRLFARNLTVTDSEGIGLCGRDASYVDVAHSTFADCAVAGAVFDHGCSGRLVDCSVSGTKGKAVQHNGNVELVSLRTSLPVVRKSAPPAEPPPTIINHGPVIHGDVHGSRFAWNNDVVTQNQQPSEGDGSNS